MMECPSCHRLFPEVVGAPTQVCPHCQHETTAFAPASAPPRPADPVGAVVEAAAIARRRYHVLLLLWLPALVVEVAATFALGAYEGSIALPSDPTTGQLMQYAGLALPLLLLVYTVKLACWSLVAAEALEVPVRSLRWPLALASGLVLALTYAAGLALALVGFLVFLHWFLYVPAAIAGGARSLPEAFDASRRFARERRTTGFTALVVLLGALILAVGFALPAYGGAVASWLLSPFVALLPAAYWRVSREAPAPDDAPARARSGSTRCPRCASLIQYEPTGAPVAVTCPSCGYAGRVL